MRVSLLGTGSALPSPRRVQSGIYLTDGSRSLLIDCGSGIVHRLAQAGIDHRAVDTVLLTHHHLDHVADLPTLLKARWLTDESSLTVHGASGTRELSAHLFALDRLDERTSINVHEWSLEEFPATIAGYPIDAAPAEHSAASYAYRIGDALAISGDTEPTESVMELADGVHTLVHECANPDGIGGDGHTTPSELGATLETIEVTQIFLTHLFPQAEAVSEQLAATVSEYTDAAVTVANDLTTIEIPDPAI